MKMKIEKAAVYDHKLEDVKICIDCKYNQTDGVLYTCNRFTSIINGQREMIDCYQARMDENLCGFYGRQFEQKDKTK